MHLSVATMMTHKASSRGVYVSRCANAALSSG